MDFLTQSQNYKIKEIIYNELSGFGVITEISLEDEFLGIKYFSEEYEVEEDFKNISKIINLTLSDNSKYSIREFTISKHKEQNQMYGDKPYSFHLEYVNGIANKFLHLIPEKDIDTVITACWCHDLLEDTDLSYEQLKQITNEEVANIVLSVTTKGGTRKERFNTEYYNGIKNVEFADFVKLCDRIANVRYSIENKNEKKLKMYQKEHSDFHLKLWDFNYPTMFNYLSQLFYNPDKINY